jgi:hypothetical protein
MTEKLPLGVPRGSDGVGDSMAITKKVAGLAALAVGAAVVTALAGVGPEGKAKTDRADVVATSVPACAPEPWPYGCQWREPAAPRHMTRGGR